MRMTTLLTSVSLTLLATMALAQSVTYEYDRAANFSNYKRYAWTRGTELPDTLIHARVVGAIDAALAAKGLVRVEPAASPDLLVAYHASFEKNLEITGSTHGFEPFGLGDRWGAATVQPVLVGTLVVDLSDARTHAMVWRSLASSDVRPGDKPETRDKKLARATQKMFKNYPPKP
jgi:predicted nucleic acid-binding protein